MNVSETALDFASASDRSHEAGDPERFRLTDRLDVLRAGDNVLAIVALNLRPTSRDFSIIPELGVPAPLVHADFRLSSTGGETIFLREPDGTLAGRVEVPPQIRDRSYGRADASENEYAYLVTPTPAAPNDTLSSASRIPTRPFISPTSGEYEEGIEAVVFAESFPFEGAEVRYTLCLLYTSPSPRD